MGGSTKFDLFTKDSRGDDVREVYNGLRPPPQLDVFDALVKKRAMDMFSDTKVFLTRSEGKNDVGTSQSKPPIARPSSTKRFSFSRHSFTIGTSRKFLKKKYSSISSNSSSYNSTTSISSVESKTKIDSAKAIEIQLSNEEEEEQQTPFGYAEKEILVEYSEEAYNSEVEGFGVEVDVEHFEEQQLAAIDLVSDSAASDDLEIVTSSSCCSSGTDDDPTIQLEVEEEVAEGESDFLAQLQRKVLNKTAPAAKPNPQKDLLAAIRQGKEMKKTPVRNEQKTSSTKARGDMLSAIKTATVDLRKVKRNSKRKKEGEVLSGFAALMAEKIETPVNQDDHEGVESLDEDSDWEGHV